MRALVIDTFGSFSLIPYLKAEMPTYEFFSLQDMSRNRMWEVVEKIDPDVIFIDFANENAVAITDGYYRLKRKPKVVIRLHGYEAQSWFMQKIRWEHVSDLIVVSEKFKQIVEPKVPTTRVHVVHNGIDLNKFQLKDMEDNTDIAYLGYLNKKKGPTLLRTLAASCPDRNFHIGGSFQDEQVRLYMADLRLSNVTYYGWVDTVQFLKHKRFVLSTSVTESFGMSIGEGMAMGLTPMVHWWPGAELLWPREWLWRTFQEFQDIKPLEPALCRKWVEDRYSMDSCIEKVTALLKG